MSGKDLSKACLALWLFRCMHFFCNEARFWNRAELSLGHLFFFLHMTDLQFVANPSFLPAGRQVSMFPAYLKVTAGRLQCSRARSVQAVGLWSYPGH